MSTAHYVESDVTIDAGTENFATATCPAGEYAVGGYYKMRITGGLNDGNVPGDSMVTEAGMLNFNDYEVGAADNQGFGDKVLLQVFAICAKTT